MHLGLLDTLKNDNYLLSKKRLYPQVFFVSESHCQVCLVLVTMGVDQKFR